MKIKYYKNVNLESLVNTINIKNEASLDNASLDILNIDKILCSDNATKISGETSNEIEGLSIKRSKNIKKVKQLNQNYNAILNDIKLNSDKIDLSLETILSWHKKLFEGVDMDKTYHIGVWKQKQNYVDKEPMASVAATPILMKELILWWEHEQTLNVLIKIPLFIINFLRIHPFEDGNGRMSRLITNYLLIANNYNIVKYISIENYMLQNKSQYFESIRTSTIGWSEENNNADEFIKFYLEMLDNCFKVWMDNLDFHQMIKTSKLKKRDIVLLIINELIETNIPVTKQNIKDAIRLKNLNIDDNNIKDSLKALTTQGYIAFRKTETFSCYECNNKAIKDKAKELLSNN